MRANQKYFIAGVIVLVLIILLLINSSFRHNTEIPSRESKIPLNAIKITPETDNFPPQMHSESYEKPLPLSVIDTAGAEDSAFIMPEGNTLYFFFTPDVSVPVEKQIIDEVTGIYVSKKQNSEWTKPQRLALQKTGKLSLDGCEFVQDTIMWFCSAREGYAGVNLFTAELKNGKWQNWKYAGDKLMKDYQVGEMHIAADGKEMYFHSMRDGGKGGLDIWTSKKINGEWQQPENVEGVNTAESEGWPFITEDGNELWFTRTYQGTPAVYMSNKIDGKWSEPQLIISQFAGEPSLDKEGNIYFTHHFYKNNKMLEADIYFAKKK